MKKYSFIIFTLGILVCSFFSCDDEEKEETGAWNTARLEEYTVTPINGGAVVSYTIPNDPEILYVMAEYERNGKTYTEKSSVHKNELTIEGFHHVEKVKAALYKVNRHEQKSEPLYIEFEPKESLISIAQHSLKMIPTFGGIIASWNNPCATELGVRLMIEKEEENNELVTSEMYFSTIPKERHKFRGFEAKETTFAISFEDKWGNNSDTIRFQTKPFFETLVPKPYADFRSFIPYDNIWDYPGRSLSMLWDNIVNTRNHGWFTSPGHSGLSITFDMKQVVKLSRIVIHGYHIDSPYWQCNITRFEVWGTNKIDYSKLSDRPYWLDEFSVRNGAIHEVDPAAQLPERTFKDDWFYLGDHSIPRYTDPQTIKEFARRGAEYEMPIDAPPVRYIRLFAREVTSISPPPANNYFSMGEITFYGDNTVPQE